MMVNSISLSSLQDVYQNSMVTSMLPEASSVSGTDSMQLSQEGQLFSAIMGLDEDDGTEVLDYMEQLRESMASGSFDAAQAAADAPEALSSLAEENGLDLEELLAGMAERMESGQPMAPPPPPPMMPGMEAGLTEEESTELAEFWEQLRTEVEEGTFDAASAAADAPETLAEYAEATGTSLEDLLQDAADRMEEGQNMAPPPPPPSSSFSGYLADGTGIAGGVTDTAQVMLEALSSLQSEVTGSWWSSSE